MAVVPASSHGGSTPDLAAVLAVGNTAGRSVVVDGDSDDYLQGPGTPSIDGGGAAMILMGAAAGANGGNLQVIAGSASAPGGDGGSAFLKGGDGWGAAGGSFIANTGTDTLQGTAAVRTHGSAGVSGQALVSDGNNQLAYGGVRVAAAVPVAAPASVLPFAYDTTAVTGGFYFWDGAAWVKVAAIL